MTEQENTNPYEHQYKPNDLVEIPGNALLNTMYFLEEVIASQPKLFSPYSYAKDVKVLRDKEGNINSIKTEWEAFPNIQTFLQTIEEPIPGATKLTIMAEQLFFAFNNLHKENIDKGLAKKLGSLTKLDKDA